MFFTQGPNQSGRVDVEVWRRVESTPDRVKSNWGDYEETPAQAPAHALYGRELHHTIYDCVMEPRTTRIETRPEYNERITFTGITIFMSPYEDIAPDDFLAFIGVDGEYDVYKIEGEGETNNYVSPFSGIVGGREIFAMRYREAK